MRVFGNRKGLAALAAGILISVIFFSCAGTPSGKGAPAAQGPTSQPLFYGYGKADSSIKAMNLGKKEAVRKAADALLGVAVATVKKTELDQFFDGVKDFNIYVYPETLISLSSGQEGDGFYYHLGVRVNLEALGNSLKSNMLLGGQVTGQVGVAMTLPDEKAPAGTTAQASAPAGTTAAGAPAQGSPAAPPADLPEPTPEEQRFVEQYMTGLTYMVYYNEDSPTDPFLMKAAVVSANRYLNQHSMAYVDLQQIENLKKDQEMVYEEETGEAVSIIQWIAHKLNADIYIEVNLNVNSRSEGNRHYGSATVTLNNYEASTADGRGAASYQTNPPAYSTVSEADAVNNAVTSAIYQAMPAALNSLDAEMRKALTQGLKFNLTILNTLDSRLMRDFERKLERRVKSLRKISFSPEQSVYEVRMLGEIVDLEDLVYDVVDTIPELSGITLVMQQRSSLTFDSGL